MATLIYRSNEGEEFELSEKDFLVDMNGQTILVKVNGARVPMKELLSRDFNPRTVTQEIKNRAMRTQFYPPQLRR